MKTQEIQRHKDDRNGGNCPCSNGKIESQCEQQARKNGRLNSRAHWEKFPHDGGVVISVHRSTNLRWGSQTLGNKMGAMGPVRWYRPRWTQWARNLRNHFKSSVYFNIGGFILLLKGQNLKKKSQASVLPYAWFANIS